MSTPPLYMAFSFIGARSARYGSWGMLESVTQDTTLVPAPKYRAIMAYIQRNTSGTASLRSVPFAFGLDQNYPNPFNPGTTLRYTVEQQGPVLLTVFDVLGREIAILVNEFHGASPAASSSSAIVSRLAQAALGSIIVARTVA